MQMNLNGRERSENAFSELFASVSPRLKLAKVYRPAMGELSLIEVRLAEPGCECNVISQTVHINGDPVNGHLDAERLSPLEQVIVSEEGANGTGIAV